MLPDLERDNIVSLHRAHPWGEDRGKVVGLGADIKIECLGWERQVLLPRRKLSRSIKSNLSLEERNNG